MKRIKGQRVLRSYSAACKWTCSCLKIDANHSSCITMVRCCEFQSKKKKKRDAVVIDKAENVKEVIHEGERGNGDRGQRVTEIRWQRGA